MSGISIAQEVAAGIAEAGFAVGGEAGFVVTLKKKPTDPNEPTDPWSPAANPANPEPSYELRAVDSGIKDFYGQGGQVVRTSRVIILEAGVVVPRKGDKVFLEGKWNVIKVVHSVAPGGVDLMYKLELEV